MLKLKFWKKKKDSSPKTVKQVGLHPSYPQVAYYWRNGEPMPSWLSDNVRIILKETGEKILDAEETNEGNLIIKGFDGNSITKIPKVGGILVYSKETGIIGLTEDQFNLLYE